MTDFHTKAFKSLYDQGPRSLVFGLLPHATSHRETGLAATWSRGGPVTRRSISCADVDEMSLTPDPPIASTDTRTSFQPDPRPLQEPTPHRVATAPKLMWADGDVAGFIIRLFCAMAPLGAIGGLFMFH